jgi:DNA-binding NtrC family response regulator
MRLLCVDDDKTFLQLYESTMKRHCQPGDEVLVAANAGEARSLLRGKRVDLLITDLVMPDVSGLELLTEAKAINPKTEVIVVTGQGSIDSAVQAIKNGARDYLTKPLNTGVLIQRVENVREMLSRAQEAEDYRFAKDVVEENAGRSVAEMEVKLEAARTAFRKIREIASGPDQAEQKVRLIANVLANGQAD